MHKVIQFEIQIQKLPIQTLRGGTWQYAYSLTHSLYRTVSIYLHPTFRFSETT